MTDRDTYPRCIDPHDPNHYTQWTRVLDTDGSEIGLGLYRSRMATVTIAGRATTRWVRTGPDEVCLT